MKATTFNQITIILFSLTMLIITAVASASAEEARRPEVAQMTEENGTSIRKVQTVDKSSNTIETSASSPTETKPSNLKPTDTFTMANKDTENPMNILFGKLDSLVNVKTVDIKDNEVTVISDIGNHHIPLPLLKRFSTVTFVDKSDKVFLSASVGKDEKNINVIYKTGEDTISGLIFTSNINNTYHNAVITTLHKNGSSTIEFSMNGVSDPIFEYKSESLGNHSTAHVELSNDGRVISVSESDRISKELLKSDAGDIYAVFEEKNRLVNVSYVLRNKDKKDIDINIIMDDGKSGYNRANTISDSSNISKVEIEGEIMEVLQYINGVLSKSDVLRRKDHKDIDLITKDHKTFLGKYDNNKAFKLTDNGEGTYNIEEFISLNNNSDTVIDRSETVLKDTKGAELKGMTLVNEIIFSKEKNDFILKYSITGIELANYLKQNTIYSK